MKLLITGCFGFIGFNFIKHVANNFPNDFKLIGIDNLSGQLSNVNKNIFNYKNFDFIELDINDISQIGDSIRNIDLIINFAAESHVDNSISFPEKFIHSNIAGLVELLMFSVTNKVPKFFHISTDEVYGSSSDNYFKESDRFNPSSPYSASKASAELICKSFENTYNFQTLILRPSNNYGPYQQPEKLIPYSISNLLKGKNIEIYGDGKNIRHWLHVEDTINSILHLLSNDYSKGVFNIGSGEYFDNLYVSKKILDALDLDLDRISFVKDRPGHDFRYASNYENLLNTGWLPKRKFDDEIDKIVEWYKSNEEWLSKGTDQVYENREKRFNLNQYKIKDF